MNLSAYTSDASGYAHHVDTIFYGLSAASILVVLLVAGLIVGFALRYRRGSPAKRGAMPHFMRNEFEIGWTVATLFLFMFIFWWAASAQLNALTPPRHAMQIHVVAKQWMWKVQQPSGIREINEMHVPLGKEILLDMTSKDVIHSFFVPALRIKQDVLPDRVTHLWFKPDKVGTFGLLCAEYCGTGHSRMTGKFIVMKAQAYARWAAVQPQTPGLAQEGEALFRQLGCSGCHSVQSSVHAPDLHGVFHHKVHLSDGRTVMADEQYLRDSILQPRRDVVAGFTPIMPSFKGVVSNGQLVKLLAYLKSLSVNSEAHP